MPPKQNIKLRFTNIFTAVDWAEKMLLQWDYLPEQVQTACEWLQKNKGFIEELIVIRTHCGFILGLLKNESFSDVIHQRILVVLGVNKADVKKEKEAYFYQEIILCLERLATIQSEIRLGKGCGLICCSDIIESIFGKFKQKSNK